MESAVRERCVALGVAVVIGAVVGCLAGVALSATSGFVAWGGFVWSVIGAASLGLGFVAAEITRLVAKGTGRESRGAGTGAILASAVLAGASAAALLSWTASVTVLGGAVFFALVSAGATYGATRRRTRVAMNACDLSVVGRRVDDGY
ncbi:hypothetical protein [Sanguibacter suaedae]|uniref:Uncharacterized protein n=1 Tax=Sanguibacter suaedae TaxID=2795737 RepID=A0A934I9F2_9MICO|nr:hypothetical protein [Sanguibacter suaedae]MBI9113798.1 hypothetical protein [Sanguibacter suaedae]